MTRLFIRSFAMTVFLSLPFLENARPMPPIPSPDVWQLEMLDLVNQVRAQGCHCGSKRMPPAPPLAWNNRLAKAANGHATDMQRNRFIGHRGTNGSSIGQRVERAGYRWQSVAENVAWNTETVQSTVQGWKDSPAHCRSLMGKEYSEMGAAHVGDYWVQVFGREME